MTAFMNLLSQNDHFPIAEFKHVKLCLEISLMFITIRFVIPVCSKIN